MFKKTRLAVAVIGCIALYGAGSTHAQGLANGGFESPGFAFTDTTDNYRELFNGDSTTLTGWTVIDDGIGFASYVFHSTRYPVHGGSYAVTLNQGSGLSTTVSLVAGQGYRLTAWMQNAALNYEPAPLQVSIGGLDASWSIPFDDSPYRLMSFDFTAATSDAAAILRLFNGSSAGDFKAYTLDDISLAAVPEPGSGALVLAGLGVLGWMSRRRRG